MAVTSKKKTKKKKDADLKQSGLFDGLSNEIETSDNLDFKVKQHSHFDIINSIFKGSPEWREFTKSDKQRSFFMLNRSSAAKYPLQAQALNLLEIEPSQAVEVWKSFFERYEHSGFVPYFFFRKGSKRSKETIEKRLESSWTESIIRKYAQYKKMSLKDVNDMIELLTDDMDQEYKKFTERLSLEDSPNKQISKISKK